MKVVVPYTDLHPLVKTVLDSYQLPTTYVALPTDDSYRQLLKRLWDEGETVCLVEHDIVPWYGCLEELDGCMGQWCTCAYRYGGGYGLYHLLGCTKLSATLMRRLPGLWDQPRPWSELDRHLFFAAREIGQDPHGHRPPVLHLNLREY